MAEERCRCGKVRYTDRRMARQAAKEARGRGAPKMREYRCAGGFWHLTSQATQDTEYWRRRTAARLPLHALWRA